MPNWNQVLDEIKEVGSPHDLVRRRYSRALSERTQRNVIIYYSGWLQKPNVRGSEINDADKSGFMSVIRGLDRSIGLDLILHTPGGDLAATESIVDYLRSMFGTDIRALVPQLAMSAGTMISCSCKEIVMGKHSSLGPIDPQFNGIPAHGVLEEFDRARKEIAADPSNASLWYPILNRYSPTLVGECEKAIDWSEQLVSEWLRTGMFQTMKKPEAKIKKILTELGDHAINKNHARHLSLAKCKEIGLKVVPLEADPDLQDAVLSLHHASIHTLSSTSACKIIENQNGTALINTIVNG